MSLIIIFLLVILLAVILGSVKTMNEAIERLRAEVSENNDAIQSAVTLISGIAEQLRDAAGDEDAVNELADQLDTQSNELANAVASNTPADPEAPPADTGTPVEEPPVE